MDSYETRALVRLSDRRFQSFSEAAEAVLGALEEVVPGTLMLGQFDPDEQTCRVIEVRGDGVNGMRRGSTVPLAEAMAVNGNGNGSSAAMGPESAHEARLDGEYLRSLAVKTWLATPLEMSDGTITGTLCAMATHTDAFCTDHAALLGISARLLSYEWESINRRAELRRLREEARDGATTDSDTGLPNRESFVANLDREWRLAERGTVQSVLVTCEVGIEEGVGGAMAKLALKDAAEVLGATIRTTDHAGRVGDSRLAAILIGCEEDGARAFVRRFESAVRRVTHARPHPIRLSYALMPLAGTPSPTEALNLANPTWQLEEETAG